MDWFQQLRAALPAYWPIGTPADIVGYLQGSPSALDWRRMIQGGREQMIILGSVPPSNEDWLAAGVAQRRAIQTIRYADLNTFIITYGGFIRRPWGKISTLSMELVRDYGSVTIPQFKRNAPRR
jgi:hypothetical protein